MTENCLKQVKITLLILGSILVGIKSSETKDQNILLIKTNFKELYQTNKFIEEISTNIINMFIDNIYKNYQLNKHSSWVKDDLLNEEQNDFKIYWNYECQLLFKKYKLVLLNILDNLLNYSILDLKIIFPPLYQLLSLLVKISECLECQQRLNTLVVKSGKFL